MLNMKAVIDSCSIILLAKAEILQLLAENRNLIISKSVYAEVVEGRNIKLLEALLLERLVNEKIVTIEDNVNKNLVEKLRNDFNLGDGEAESIELAMEKQDKLIITDNKQGRKAAKVYNLNVSGSLGCVMALFKLNKIDKEKARNTLKKLKESGWFQDYLIETALGEIQNG